MPANFNLPAQKRLQALETNAINYPNVHPSDFERSFLLSIDRGKRSKMLSFLDAEPQQIQRDGEVRLAGSLKSVPTYTLTVRADDGTTHTLQNRVALAAIGSNSSPDVLFDKFMRGLEYSNQYFNNLAQDFGSMGKRQDICVLSAKLPGHAVVYGAFLGVRGSVPATIHAMDGVDATITIGFYTRAAAEHMTGTEPNYVGMALAQSAVLAGGVQIDTPIAYVSPWGVLHDPANDGAPIALSAIPTSSSPLRKMPSAQVIPLVANLCGEDALDGEDALRAFIRSNIDDGTPDQTNIRKRLARIAHLQANHCLPPNVEGDVVFDCSIRRTNPLAAAIMDGLLAQEGAQSANKERKLVP